MSDKNGTCACCCSDTDEAIAEIGLYTKLNEIILNNKEKPGALIPVLQQAQSVFGYIPEKAMRIISDGLGESYSRVFGVVTFYSFFSRVPRGKYLVRVCLGTACYVRGANEIVEKLKDELKIDIGGTTADKVFSLDVGRCFGACGLAPVIMINDDVHQQVKPSKIRSILNTYSKPVDEGNKK